jgi:hypothetical protein
VPTKFVAKVSFDFDGVLSRSALQDFARQLLAAGVDVWIVTMRFATHADMARHSDEAQVRWEGNDDLFAVASRLGIPREKVVFTNGDWKSAAIRKERFVFHLDDCSDTLRHIRTHCRHTRAINCWNTTGWKDTCLERLNEVAATRRARPK